ncbi:MAG TPA: LamG-like jellyroll fold domain-containing protein [Pyrinomonadaceae bacterium]
MRFTLPYRTCRRDAASPHAVVVAVSRRAVRFTAAIALMLGLTSSAAAQEYTNNKPDQALKSDARVDPSTLGMSLGVPLGGVAGRAGVSLPISLRYSSKLWRMETGSPSQPNIVSHTYGYPKYSENSVAGWTSSLEPPRIEFTGGNQLFGPTGQPLGADESYACYVRRIQLHLPDGSSHELRKDDETPCFYVDGPSYDFSGMYYAVDGSRTRYDYDAGVLYLPDGSRYVFGEFRYFTRHGNYVEGRWGETFIDRHGNTMTYNISTGVWTDTLGRTVTNPLFKEPAVNQITEYPVPGVNGDELIYKLHWKSLQDALRVWQSLRYTSGTFCGTTYTATPTTPGLFSGSSAKHICADPAPFNPVVLARIELPNGQFYDFKYNVWGEIEQVTAPGGGYERYSYGQVATLSRANAPYDQTNRGVIKRWVSPSGTGAEEATHHWSYSITKSTGYVTATTTEPDGTRSERLIYANSFGTQYGFETPLAGMSYDERVYNSSNQMLRRTLTGWSTVTPSGSTHPRDPHVTKTVGLILDTGGNALSSTTTMAYDADLNVTAKHSYDYASVNQTTAQTGAIGAIPNGALTRTDETTYLVNDPNISTATREAYRARNMIGLPSSTRVKNAAGTAVAQSEVKYDEADYAPLPCGAATGWSDPGAGVVRGSATTTRHWLDTTYAWLATHAQYDGCGNLRKAWDARTDKNESERVTEIEYSAAYKHAYPTHTKSPVPDPSNNRASNTPLETWTTYDLSTGKVTSTTDANHQITYLRYTNDSAVADPLDRLRRVEYPDGGVTKYNYSDTPGDLYTQTISYMGANQTNPVESRQYFDGLGRPTRAFLYDGTASTPWAVTDTHYDAMGRVWKTSNPYRVSAPSAILPAPSECTTCTTTLYDALGRVTTVTTPDNAVVTSDYSGAQVTVTDQKGKSRRSGTDALGRLTQVVEDPAGLAYQTNYAYDVLGNLRKVDQGGQLRYFMYDSLSRLIRARNPEQVVNGALALQDSFKAPEDAAPNKQWTLKYTYDANGNLATKTDARGVTTTHQYDNLNRLKQTDYTGGTAHTLRTYDHAPTNGRGRFYADYESSTSGTLNYVEAYDSMGRPTAGKTEFYLEGTGWRPAYTYARLYDKMGHVTKQTYPSGNTANYSQFDVAGRLKQFAGNLGDGTPRPYSTNIEYDEASRLLQEQFATTTPLYNKLEYNARGQKTAVRLSTRSRQAAYYNWNRGALIFDYGTTSNNGNLVSQHNWVPITVANDEVTSGTSYQQGYSYDSLNRLTLMQESRLDEGLQFQQGYEYDRWGNRTINQGATTQTLPPKMRKEFTVAAQTNQLGVPGTQVGVMSYDPAGNLTEDSYTGAGVRTYDAENRMTSATTGINSSSYYTYDAAGKRVRRQNSNEAAVWQVYGFDGELLAEYASNASPASPQKEYGYRNGELLVVAESGTAASQPDGTPYGGTPAALPGTIEAEHFNGGGQGTAYHDTTPGSHGQDYDQAGYPPPALRQPTDVDIYRSTAVYSNGHLIVMQAGDRTSYTADIAAAGTYTLEARVAAGGGPGGTFHVEVDGVDKTGPVQIPDTGWSLQLITKTGVQLSAGRHVLRVVADANAANGYTGNLDYIRLAQATSTLAGYWKFNEAGGTVTADSSGKGHTGTLSGAAWAAGQFDGAVSFDGINDYVSMGAPAGLVATNAVTMSAWIYPTGAGSDPLYGGAILSKEGEYELARFADGSIAWALANSQPGWSWVNTGYVAALNQWTHVSVVYDGAWVKTYANNVLVHTQAATGAIGDTLPGQNEFRVGGRQAVGQHFQGRIDEVRVYGSALAASEVAELAVASGNIRWLVTDHLGTPRMVVDLSGDLDKIKRHDYLPFGEELIAGQGGRTPGQGYVGDNLRHRYTTYERDFETGLDYAQARYYASAQGRFTSPDPLITSAKPINPQSWNRYAYVLNSPLVLIDPSGLEYRRNDKSGEIKWYNKDDDREGTTEYTNEFFQTNEGRWVRLNQNGPSHNANDSTFDRRGWDYVAENTVPEAYLSMYRAGGVSPLDDPPSSGGYMDINLSFGSPIFLGPTGGLLIDNNNGLNFYPYIGGGLMTPGPGTTVTFSPDSVSGGFNAELQGAFGLAGAVGVDEGGNSFTNVGAGSPGASATVYYVFGAPHPNPPGTRRASANAAVNTNSSSYRSSPSRNCACNVSGNIP